MTTLFAADDKAVLLDSKKRRYLIDLADDGEFHSHAGFVRHSDIGLPFLIDYLNTWEHNIAELDNASIIRYEDLRSDTADTLMKITALMGENFSDEEIAEAVSFGSFDNLRKLETSGFFRRGGMRLRNANDPETFKVRRGKVGGYGDYFTEDQTAELEELMMTRLSPVFGYRPAERARN